MSSGDEERALRAAGGRPDRRTDIAGALVAISMLVTTACAPLAIDESRAARSSLSCMRAALDGRDLSALPDEQAHCMAAALIARRCSVSEAALASVSKEIRDAFGSGDAEWRDLRADRRGIRCAQAGAADQQLSACCIGAEGS